MSGSVLTDRELDNILLTYADFGAERLGDYIREIWKEAWEEGDHTGYRRGYSAGYAVAKRGE